MTERVRYVVMKVADIPEGARRAPYPDSFTVAAVQPFADELNRGVRDCWAWRYSGKHCDGPSIVDLDSIAQPVIAAPEIATKPAPLADRNAPGRIAAIEAASRGAWSAEVKAKLAVKAEAKRAEVVCQPNYVDDGEV